MAQTTRKKRTSTNSSTKKNTRTNSRTKTETGIAKQPRRREAMAIVCFGLGVLSFIGYFDTEPVFIAFFTGFVRRLIGYGFYALPPALIMCAVILAFHKGRPIRLRTTCTLLLTVITGSLAHIFLVNADSYEFSFLMIGDLWRSGAELSSGGVISGTISELFLLLFGGVGASITFIILAALSLMVSFNATISGLIEAFNKREKREYIPEPESEFTDEAAAVNLPVRNHQTYQNSSSRNYKRSLIPSWKKKKIDIPIDENGSPPIDHFAEDYANERKSSTYNNKPRVKTPDKMFVDNAVDDTNENQHGKDDMPLDIPFMEGKGRERTSFMPLIVEEKTSAFVEPPAPSPPPKPIEPSTPAPKVAKAKKNAELIVPTQSVSSDGYTFPPLDLLSQGKPQSRAGDSEVRQNTERLETAFQSFGVNVHISNATRGPTVTRYEAELEAGVKLNKLTSLEDDIALSLGANGVRIAAMPNRRSTVGIEVPNKDISKVHLRDVIESRNFSQAKSKLTFAIGMDISGEPIVGDITKLPHMLVAGTTGSGKSVCLNSIILSILYKSGPEDVRFIMIDPKMVELKAYNSIPHLLVPVVTDAQKAAGALQWAVFEMMKRYTLFAETNARDIESYNQIVRNSKDEEDEREPMSKVVVIIDELADLMMVAAKDVEESICRIAQMGRAAGIHLITATQSPRADVITGLIKANIPSRIAFKVSSSLESRIILDSGSSADKLVGYGDMLYSPTGAAKPMRLQGAWVSDDEREGVIEFLAKDKGEETQYSEEVMNEIEKAASMKASGGQASGGSNTNDYDDLLPQAVDVIMETGQASVSLLQRRLKLGYSRAARIVDQMEEMGVVGPFEGSKPRNILITRDQWNQMQHLNGIASSDAENEGNG
ncbi:MAG: DNA translocase FtsK [Oscillospiraceae bacterium]|nr:DNA translocase FtsK [Oscillospiraceae bacterium]